MKTIYLCGPINGCNDSEANDWRQHVMEELAGHYDFLDPMRRDYRGRELEPGIAAEIVNGDKEDLRQSDIVLAFCPKPSVGTSMELFLFWSTGGENIIVHPNPNPSPWLIEHSAAIYRTFDEAIQVLQSRA